MKVDWIKKTKEGIQVKGGSFYVDPIYPVKKAIITHGHADHARAGHEHVIGTLETLEIMKERYGNNFCKKSTLSFNEKILLIYVLHSSKETYWGCVKKSIFDLSC